MTKIEFRYRKYKDPTKRGTYLLVNGKQTLIVSARQLTLVEMNKLRKQMLLSNKGYIQQNQTKFQKAIKEDQIKEVNFSDLNTEIIDIKKDPKTNEWKKEKKPKRDYLDPVDENKYWAEMEKKL